MQTAHADVTTMGEPRRLRRPPAGPPAGPAGPVACMCVCACVVLVLVLVLDEPPAVQTQPDNSPSAATALLPPPPPLPQPQFWLWSSWLWSSCWSCPTPDWRAPYIGSGGIPAAEGTRKEGVRSCGGDAHPSSPPGTIAQTNDKACPARTRTVPIRRTRVDRPVPRERRRAHR